jgi:peptide/nickel transport system ATP-binding protein
VLTVERLTVELDTAQGPGRAVRDVSFALARGETLGIVGESGCGKSMTALALMGLLPDGARVSGSIRFEGEELVGLDENALCKVRGDRIGMIFQEPMTALNPVHTIGKQVAEPLQLHRGLDAASARAAALRLLDRVGIAQAGGRLDAYPHQLSGGQRQRVMIAMALACEPVLLIADEPTTALDVTIQGQILVLIRELITERGMGLILISHNLGLIAETVDRVAVMYGGAIVEQGPTAALFGHLAHPYTKGLFAALPQLGAGRQRLATIAGTVPELAALPHGCTFADRCPIVIPACRPAPPPQVPVDPEHTAACIRLDVAATLPAAGQA